MSNSSFNIWIRQKGQSVANNLSKRSKETSWDGSWTFSVTVLEDVEKRKYSPSGFNHFLRDVVEEVPAAEGEGRLQEGQSDLTHRRRPVQGEGHLRSQRLVVPWRINHTFEWFLFTTGGSKALGHRLRMLPLQIWTRPTTMMRPRAISFPTVKTSWILVAIRTLEQFTQVSSTEQKTHCVRITGKPGSGNTNQ